MSFDLLAAVDLTLSAAVVVATLSVGFGATTARRIGLAAALGAWFVVVAVLASTRALHDEPGLGTPALGFAVVLPIVILSLAVRRSPRLRPALDRVPLWLLIGVNTVRVLGVFFVLLYVAGRLPAPFAPVAGWGDVVAGTLAVPVAWLAHRRGVAARSAIFAWNAFGLLDLVAAVGLGVASSPGPLRVIFAEPGSSIMTTLPWMLIPAFLVPLLFSTHLAVFYRLRGAAPQ